MLNIKNDYDKLNRRYGKVHAVILTIVSLICLTMGIINIILSFTIEFNWLAILTLSVLGFFLGIYFLYLLVLRWYIRHKISLL